MLRLANLGIVIGILLLLSSGNLVTAVCSSLLALCSLGARYYLIIKQDHKWRKAAFGSRR
jgi:hypothetical protein